MPPVDFEPAISKREPLQTQVLDHAVPGIGCAQYFVHKNICGNLGTPEFGRVVARLAAVGRLSLCH
jgi:hypothetical protein